jgi:hypothetical protein
MSFGDMFVLRERPDGVGTAGSTFISLLRSRLGLAR